MSTILEAQDSPVIDFLEMLANHEAVNNENTNEDLEISTQSSEGSSEYLLDAYLGPRAFTPAPPDLDSFPTRVLRSLARHFRELSKTAAHASMQPIGNQRYDQEALRIGYMDVLGCWSRLCEEIRALEGQVDVSFLDESDASVMLPSLFPMPVMLPQSPPPLPDLREGSMTPRADQYLARETVATPPAKFEKTLSQATTDWGTPSETAATPLVKYEKTLSQATTDWGTPSEFNLSNHEG
ncbi:uncharacterized protein TRAVEDRAFT_42604 [Trametes versicolor FP-101664 SS1]|uniref:uncharacterized protein n=1 Tax=Trametes versicolor (strain FP-101664) TaxID=717944 RepID=UPI0004621F28|nr:uncharacterized protein TRAVEDRAFT_42604 [Trametes versicolor FP-101664 SS1]EIW65225.1 hypothetical protein TRAVEDRAFT_42604 [Trametes versicolor FP-101664 SS1]